MADELVTIIAEIHDPQTLASRLPLFLSPLEQVAEGDSCAITCKFLYFVDMNNLRNPVSGWAPPWRKKMTGLYLSAAYPMGTLWGREVDIMPATKIIVIQL